MSIALIICLHTFALIQTLITCIPPTNPHSLTACQLFDKCSERGPALACLHASNFSCACVAAVASISQSTHNLACERIFKRLLLLFARPYCLITHAIITHQQNADSLSLSDTWSSQQRKQLTLCSRIKRLCVFDMSLTCI